MFLSAANADEDVPVSNIKEANAILERALSFDRIQSLSKSDFEKAVDKAMDDYRILIRPFFHFKDSDTDADKFMDDVIQDARRYIITSYGYIKENGEAAGEAAADFSRVVSNAADDVTTRVGFYTEEKGEVAEDPVRYIIYPLRRRLVGGYGIGWYGIGGYGGLVGPSGVIGGFRRRVILYDDNDFEDDEDEAYDDYYRSYYRRGWRRLAPGY